VATKLIQILDQEGVDAALKKMAREIDMVGYPLAIVAILKGGAYATYQLLKILYTFPRIGLGCHQPDIVIGHIGLESYGKEMKSQGEVKLMTPLDLSRNDIYGRHIVIIDDCVEIGSTLKEAKKIIYPYNPVSISTAVLVDKVTLRVEANACKPDIVGWKYGGRGFLVGAGMGAAEAYRGFPEIYEVEEGNG